MQNTAKAVAPPFPALRGRPAELEQWPAYDLALTEEMETSMKTEWQEKLDGMDVDSLCIQTLRTLAIDAIQKANSGHPGAPMGCAPMAYVLWMRHLRHNPRDAKWSNRDRFVLSNGHASSMLYALLHLTGYGVSMDDLKSFRQWEAITPGHPENHCTPGVETTTGPLGQGFANAVGFAIAEAHLAERFNRPGFSVVDQMTYTLVGDGCLMEGVSAEAASLAGHLRLGKLVALYDDNGITIDGSTANTFTEDVAKRFQAYGWQTLRVSDGNDLGAIDAALAEARANVHQPTLILVKTHIGYGSPNMQDTSAVHGSPLGAEEIRLTKRFYGWPEEASFLVPERVRAFMAAVQERGAALQAEWESLFERYERAHPELAAEFTRRLAGELPADWATALPVFPVSEKGMATRAAGGKVLEALHGVLPELVGGSADLAESNKTWVKASGAFSQASRAGRNVMFGVREHGMAAVCNGMALYGGILPYGATFLVFSDYMRPCVRLGVLAHAKCIWIWTHDSIGLGEDGPTHQPVEHLAALRAIPFFHLFRPADANETAEAFKAAVLAPGPVGLALTRQNVPTLDRNALASASGTARGGYVLLDQDAPEVILIGTGSELHIALAAGRQLQAEGVRARVVSMPCTSLFDAQDEAYREQVLPRGCRARVAIEAGCSFGWERYVGLEGKVLGIDRFGASAPAEEIYSQLGLTVEAMVAAARSLLQR